MRVKSGVDLAIKVKILSFISHSNIVQLQYVLLICGVMCVRLCFIGNIGLAFFVESTNTSYSSLPP